MLLLAISSTLSRPAAVVLSVLWCLAWFIGARVALRWFRKAIGLDSLKARYPKRGATPKGTRWVPLGIDGIIWSMGRVGSNARGLYVSDFFLGGAVMIPWEMLRVQAQWRGIAVVCEQETATTLWVPRRHVGRVTNKALS